MKSKIQKSGDTINIELGGIINYEAQAALKDDLSRVIKNASGANPASRVVINMQSLRFVGSSHISMFVQALKEFQERSPVRAELINVSSEFRKVFKAYDDTSTLDYVDVLSGDKGSTRFDQ